MSLTGLLLQLAARRDFPEPTRRVARASLFDWMVCGLAGRKEPVAVAMRALATATGGRPEASVIGGAGLPARAAAWVNGATSHALDYDDTHFAHVGHLSVAIYPAALAIGERQGCGAAEVLDAFAAGAEAAIRVGLALGQAHYDRGFHQTATAGAFGATLAAGRLLGLPRDRISAALGLCASHAAGLRNQFGTMGKPLNAGNAAAAGVECALLAEAGLSAPDEGLEGPQGFLATHSDAPDPAAAMADPMRPLLDDNRYKLHACCHGTHAMIEALAALRRTHGLTGAQIASVRLRTAPRWLSVCDIKRPRTGLEVKFSYAWLAGMVFLGPDTAADRSYSDALAADAGLARFAAGVTVQGDPALSDIEARGEVILTDGRRLPFAHDLARPLAPADLDRALQAKARALLGERATTLWRAVQTPDTLSARDLGQLLRQA